MSIRSIQLTIPNGSAASKWVSAKDMSDHGSLALVGVATPGTVDAVTLAIEYSIDGGTTALTCVGSDGTAKSITQTANDYIVLSPAEYPVIPGHFRLVSSGNVGADRVYTIVGRDV